MTPTEIKEALVKVKEPSWYNELQINLNFTTVNVNLNLKEFSAIALYFKNQREGWKSISDKIPPILNSSADFFENNYNSILNFITNFRNQDKNQLNNNWNNVRNQLNSGHTNNIFTFDCPETEFLIKIYNEQPEYVQFVHSFLISYANNNNPGIQPNNPKSLIGYLLAYEFIQKDHTNITERRNSEKSSLSRLRNDFQKYLSTSEEQLNQFLKESKQKSEDYATSIDKTKEAKETEFNTWYNEIIEKHEAFTKETWEHRDNLEKTYREVLRLKEPADYWKIRAFKLQKQGRNYMNLLISLVVFSAGLLFFLLHTIPNGSIENIFNDAGKAIKWSIVLISFLSFLAYGVRLLAKASFSAFHLARDAEEREHLTYLYLSLRKDGNVSDEDRQMVLQSLFSRADTGLLKEDSSPSMPGSATSIVEKVIMKP